MRENVILKDELLIYNNQARLGQIEGGLSVSYVFFPAPAIFWEFEVFNENDTSLKNKMPGKLAHPFEGHQLIVLEPRSGGRRESAVPRRTLGFVRTGSAPKVFVGDRDLKGKIFRFYFPNTKFQSIALLHNSLAKEVAYRISDDPQDVRFVSSEREGYLQVNVTENIILSLSTPAEAIDWLKSARSTGTYLTTSGTLKLANEISIVEAVDVLENIGDLLSFANGGFVAPLIVEMTPSGFETDYPTQYSAYLVDSIERVGGSWLGIDSDIATFLECLPAYQRMLKTKSWENNFQHLLIWYFQAIQPQGIQLRGKPWPIGANALGAALEKLASIVLVDELKVLSNTKFKNATLERRIRLLLKAIGVSDLGPEYMTGDPTEGAKDAVWWFAKMRNDATHPKSSRTWTADQVNPIFWSAVQWVEEVLLWRLGYRGKYQDRVIDQWSGTEPRYDLTLRDTSW